MVVGAVERDGCIIAKSYDRFNQKDVRSLILENVDIDNSKVYTDEYRAYSRTSSIVKHSSVNHSKKYTDLYISEAVFKYNHRKHSQDVVCNSIFSGLLYV